MNLNTRFTLIGIIFLVCLNIFFIYKNNTDKHIKMNLEAATGNNIYLLVSTYKSIYEEENKLSIELIRDIKYKISFIEVYSNTIDLAVGHQVLKPIAIEFMKILDNIENELNDNHLYDEASYTYKKLTSEIKDLEKIIYKVYYDTNDHYGGKPNIKITNFNEVDHFYKNISEYAKKL